MAMEPIVASTELVAHCGLYCGACRSYRKGRCKGCHENAKAGWCKVRACCLERDYASCADCAEFADPNDCKLFNNFIARVFGFIFRSDRAACIRQIAKIGLEGHARDMAKNGRQTIRK